MEELFSLPVSYKGKEIEVQVVLRVTGYSPRFIALINAIEVTIEKDEEGLFRALNYSEGTIKDIDQGLLLATVQEFRHTSVRP
jgi:hypothetical protein